MRTLSGPSCFEVEIKRSRFIAHAERVDAPCETLAFYDRVADHSATHNCWAWKLDQQYRFHDDGEPGGSAGKPILSAIEGKGIDHVMIVVTRHFGGIKLGVGGLVRAYAGAAARCIDQASLEDVETEIECSIEADYRWTGQLYAALESCHAEKLEEAYVDGGIALRALVPESAYEFLTSLLRDTTRGEAKVRRRV